VIELTASGSGNATLYVLGGQDGALVRPGCRLIGAADGGVVNAKVLTLNSSTGLTLTAPVGFPLTSARLTAIPQGPPLRDLTQESKTAWLGIGPNDSLIVPAGLRTITPPQGFDAELEAIVVSFYGTSWGLVWAIARPMPSGLSQLTHSGQAILVAGTLDSLELTFPYQSGITGISTIRRRG
jgi:hypothetical protein